ncbi:MAG: lipopolysaccharide transport periplasmic protein LptA [Pseudomonadota bacterium]
MTRAGTLLRACAVLALCGTAALGQGVDLAFGGIAHDSSQPVEITADSLSVDQTAQTAIFEGNVVVGQGTLRLGAARIDVRYSAESSTGQIERLEASGTVTLTNGAEAAEATRAVYTVADGSVVMEGDVLLTQGQNAISGERLRIDLDAGRAVMEGRVRTIFQPGTTE